MRLLELAISAATIIILVLASIAIYLHYKLYQKRQAEKENQSKLESMLQAQQERNRKSVVVLAQAILDEQVTLTEAAIRINTLVQTLPTTKEQNDTLLVFRQISEATAHIPILDKWKALSTKDKYRFDQERIQIEARFREFAEASAKQLVQELRDL